MINDNRFSALRERVEKILSAVKKDIGVTIMIEAKVQDENKRNIKTYRR